VPEPAIVERRADHDARGYTAARYVFNACRNFFECFSLSTIASDMIAVFEILSFSWRNSVGILDAFIISF